jgi:molybdenum cofactor guanylyltransferase
MSVVIYLLWHFFSTILFLQVMTIKKQDISAIILAGGKGRRLGGQDKGLVRYKERPLIEHVLERIKPQVDHIVINANRNHTTYGDYGYSVISDDLLDYQGPLAGFATAMQYVTTDYIITLPCDGPLISNDLVARLMASLHAYPDALSSIAHDGKRLQPMYALISVNLLANLQQFLASDERKVAQWYAQHPSVLTDFSDIPHIFANINTETQRINMEQSR